MNLGFAEVGTHLETTKRTVPAVRDTEYEDVVSLVMEQIELCRTDGVDNIPCLPSSKVERFKHRVSVGSCLIDIVV